MAYQILHTFEGFLNDPQYDGMTILLGKNEEEFSCADVERCLEERLNTLRNMEIDGLVVNVGGIGYLEKEENWVLFLRCLKICEEKGFKIWIYDEKGYPSGGAGGLVLKENPAYAAVGLKKAEVVPQGGKTAYTFYEKGTSALIGYEADGKFVPLRKQFAQGETFVTEAAETLTLYYIGRVYEGTHSAGNYADKRAYINLLDKEAVKCFLKVTHRQYKKRTPAALFDKIEAFFTDEPSLMTPFTPNLDKKMANIPVTDVPDEKVPLLAALPYCDELAQFCESAPALFAQTEAPSAQKYAYWQAVTELLEKNYACTMEETCAELGVKLTGHLLWEERPFMNMAFYGNSMNVLKHFHIPGVDLLGTNVSNINVYGHKMVISAAFFADKKKIMTETNDFTSLVGHTNCASKEEIAYVLANQFLLGVNTFTFYYDFRKRTEAEYAYPNQIINRIVSFAENLVPVYDTAVYVPYETCWSGYLPTEKVAAEALDSQPVYMRETEESVLAVTEDLFRKNIPFVLCDMYTAEKLREKNIKRLVMPRCTVIDARAERAAKEIAVYGETPECYYENGRFAASELQTEDYNALPADTELPSALSYRKFEGGMYFAVNRTEQDAVLSGAARIYCPTEDCTFEATDFVIKPQTFYFIEKK